MLYLRESIILPPRMIPVDNLQHLVMQRLTFRTATDAAMVVNFFSINHPASLTRLLTCYNWKLLVATWAFLTWGLIIGHGYGQKLAMANAELTGGEKGEADIFSVTF